MPTPELIGSQTPRFQLAPPAVSSAAREAIDLCDQAGMPLDLWQQNVCDLMLGERSDGSWAAFEFGLIVPRQNGKGAVLEARELAGLFLFGEEHIVHSAHEAGTAAEAFLRMKNLIDGTAWLSKRVKKMIGSPGRQYVLLHSGQRLSYKTRTGSGGRGFSAPTVILDEAQNLTSQQIAAIFPLVSTFHYGQLIYAGTVKAGSRTFRGVVERGRQQIGARLGYAEWSVDDDADSNDPLSWAAANPAYNIRISADYVQAEHDSLVAAGAESEFRQERMSIWPPEDAIGTVIPIAEWNAGEDLQAKMPAPVTVVGVAVSPNREWASVGVAAVRPDGKTYVELIEHRAGADWLLPWLADPARAWDSPEFVIDQGSPTVTMLAAMVASGLNVRVSDTAAYKAACANFVDDVRYGRLVHRGQQPLTDAAFGVKEHRVGDSWVYARRDSGVIVAPLEAVTLAVWALTPEPSKREFFVQNLNELA